MKIRTFVVGLIISFVCTAAADTFRHKETGEVFYGFRTQRQSGGKVLVYHSEENKTLTIEQNQYEITLDEKGRRNTIIRIPIIQDAALVSKVVADRIAQSIIEASNSGPQFILIEIDSPGGRGEYIRTIATAIEQTTNCPVVAYISGGTFSGVFSGAALIPLACDEIYIAPSASIGAVGPMMGSYTDEQFAAYLSLYSSDTLAAYSGYAMGLVEREDLRLIARALVDKSVSVMEVVDPQDRTMFVERQNRQPAQRIVSTLAEGVDVSAIRTRAAESSQGIQPADIMGRVLMLNAPDAVRMGLAHHVASSMAEIAAARGVSDAQMIRSGDVDATIRRFAAARRTIGQGLASIERLEYYAANLEDQISRVEDQMRTGTTMREVRRSTPPTRRGRVNFPDSLYDGYYGIELDPGTRNARTTRSQGPQAGRLQRQTTESERTITEQPNVSLEVLRNEQAVVLRNLIAEYRRVLTLARRWPGGLPPELPAQSLEANMNSASTLLDTILRFPVQTYQQPAQQAPAQNTQRRR